MTETIIVRIVIGILYVISAISAWAGIRECHKFYKTTPDLSDVLIVIAPFINTIIALYYLKYVIKEIDASKFFRLKK